MFGNRIAALLLAGSLAACTSATTPYTSPLIAAEQARFRALVEDQAQKLDVSMADSVGCVTDTLLVATTIEDEVERNVIRNLALVYRKRVELLRAQGESLPTGAEVWWDGQDVEASAAHAAERLTNTDVEVIANNERDCRLKVVNQMTEEEITSFALAAALQSGAR